jgi:hypothetical protein
MRSSGTPELAREALQEEIDQRVDVLAPRAQRRDVTGNTLMRK